MISDSKSKEKIKNFYDDFVLIQDLYQEKANSIIGRDHFELVRKREIKKAEFIHYTNDQCLLLLKYLYIHGTILLNVVCKVLENKIVYGKGNKISQMSYRKFLEKYDRRSGISDDLKQKLYCFATYRNKLIEHHDQDRGSGSLRYKFDSYRIKLLPMGVNFFNGTGLNLDELKEIREKYCYYGGNGINEVTTWLFYNISWREKEDRKKVENFIENTGGCESYEFLQIRKLFLKLMKELEINI